MSPCSKTRARQTAFPNRQSGFTLIELLVSMVILAVLAATAFTAAKKARRAGLCAKDIANLRQLSVAMALCVSDRGGTYPTAFTTSSNGWQGPYWSDSLSPYLPRESSLVDGRNPVFYSPLFEENHYIAGYGANSFVCNAHYLKEGQPTAVSQLKVPSPAQTILIANAAYWHNGVLTGAWLVNGYGVLSSPELKKGMTDGKSVPTRGDASFSALFCDGHVGAVSYAEYLEEPSKFFGSAPFL